ncbi:NAD-dependent epimerase/dehydratase family protein [Streptomyces sp. NPDC048416]|uniref:NAD-dependent epimerase/dehydratase family protein n=1 Tax=Streptomyces sp. NPDC048416 TaxID=3365546 RepID=UPI0037216288
MRYLVTGATGFIGRHLLPLLVGEGHTVTALVRRPGRLGPQCGSVEEVQGDVVTGHGLRRAVEGAERVIHLAGITAAVSARTYAEVNAEGTRRLCAVLAGRARPPRLVYCSSLAAAGPATPGRPRHVDDVPAPVSAYGRSKLAGEHALREVSERVPGVIVRPPVVYGPGDPAFLPALAAMVRVGFLATVGSGPRRYSLIHVADLCRGLVSAAEHGTLVRRGTTAGVYQLSDGVEYSMQDLGAAVAAASGCRTPRTVSVPVPLAVAVAWGAVLASRALGSPPVFNPDKVRELRQTAWTCVDRRAFEDLAFSPSFTLDTGLGAALRAAGADRH